MNAARLDNENGARQILRALRHRNYRLFFGGQSISLIGTWLTRVATSWPVYRLTKSALLLGVVGFAGQIPTFLLAPFGSLFAGGLAGKVGAPTTILIGGVACVLGAWMFARKLPALREVVRPIHMKMGVVVEVA